MPADVSELAYRVLEELQKIDTSKYTPYELGELLQISPVLVKAVLVGKSWPFVAKPYRSSRRLSLFPAWKGYISYPRDERGLHIFPVLTEEEKKAKRRRVKEHKRLHALNAPARLSCS